jgi:hypothetical protein
MLAELYRLAREEFGDDTPEEHDAAVLNYVEGEVASGVTLTKLAARIGTALFGEPLKREMLAKWVSEAQERLGREGTLDRARATGAHALAEAGVDLIDGADTTPGAVGKAKAQLEARQFLAKAWNRDEYGEKKATTVAISFGSLHLQALMQAPVVRPAPVDGELEVMNEALALPEGES